MSRVRLWGMFAAGIVIIILGFYGMYLEHVRQNWPATDAHVLSFEYLEKSQRGPKHDRYLLKVSYNINGRDVKAQMNSSGHTSYKVDDTIPVKVDPDNIEHFVFNQADAGSYVIKMILLGIITASVSAFLLFLKKADSKRSKTLP